MKLKGVALWKKKRLVENEGNQGMLRTSDMDRWGDRQVDGRWWITSLEGNWGIAYMVEGDGWILSGKE